MRAKGRTPDQVTHVVELSLAELAAQHAHTAAVVASRCPPDEMTAVAEALRRFEPKSYVLPDEPLLAAPTVAEMQHAVGGTLISGDEALMSREVMGVVVAGMTAEHMLERLTERCGVITPADRSEVVLAVASAHAADGFPSLSGLILNGAMELHAAIADLAIPIPTVITPQMFTHQLLDHARKERKRIVLSEGSDDRILRAARRLLRHRVVDLTILGDETEIRSRAAELGVDLSDAAILDPRGSELREEFATQYAALRKSKGVTVEQADEIMQDATYFGTMLVYNGLVDGMVSGAAHTAACTVGPAFAIIRTAPDVSTVSSMVLMCLSDRVPAYGDCSIVPNPTAEQRADIAISSARTAAQFGIEPRVAMLSYFTGESGAGADVDKARAATELVRSRAPDLLIDGPIQYDAAVDPSVAATKTRDSVVADRATVLIFPELNSGNNAYKAVQRSAGAIAIGPVLQGLNKPVNDLSRGAPVEEHRQHRRHHRDPSTGRL